MPRILPIALIVGLIAGLLVGGFHNLFTVPVMERAIALEEQRAAAEAPSGAIEEEGGAEVSLGVQRIGMVVGLAVFGLILGLVFTGLFRLFRGVAPGWHPLAIALVVGALGFWALSLFPFIKYPLNPPGVGEPATLTFRQGFQTLFFFLSAAGMAAAVYGAKLVNQSTSIISHRIQRYIMVAAAYAVFALIIVFVVPGNPDLTPVPVDLLELFRALTMIGQFLLWLLLALGVAGAVMWYQRLPQESPSGISREVAQGRR